MAKILSVALLTGVFCALFAGAVDRITDMVSAGQVMTLGAVSGFLGSLFAQIVLRRRR